MYKTIISFAIFIQVSLVSAEQQSTVPSDTEIIDARWLTAGFDSQEIMLWHDSGFTTCGKISFLGANLADWHVVGGGKYAVCDTNQRGEGTITKGDCGCEIANVIKNSPAKNIEKNDAVIAIDSIVIKDCSQFRKQIRATAPGTSVRLSVLRECFNRRQCRDCNFTHLYESVILSDLHKDYAFEWKTAGFTLSEASKWKGIGVSLSDASLWKKEGVTTSEFIRPLLGSWFTREGAIDIEMSFRSNNSVTCTSRGGWKNLKTGAAYGSDILEGTYRIKKIHLHDSLSAPGAYTPIIIFITWVSKISKEPCSECLKPGINGSKIVTSYDSTEPSMEKLKSLSRISGVPIDDIIKMQVTEEEHVFWKVNGRWKLSEIGGSIPEEKVDSLTLLKMTEGESAYEKKLTEESRGKSNKMR